MNENEMIEAIRGMLQEELKPIHDKMCIRDRFLGRKGYFSRRNGEDKEVEIEYCESLDEDIFQFINRTLRGQNCKMVNIQLTEEASAYVLTAQLKTPADYDMSDLVGQLKKKSQLKRISVQ